MLDLFCCWQALSEDKLYVFEIGPAHLEPRVIDAKLVAGRPITLPKVEAALAALLARDRDLSGYLRGLREARRLQLPTGKALLTSLCKWATLRWVCAMVRLELEQAQAQRLLGEHNHDSSSATTMADHQQQQRYEHQQQRLSRSESSPLSLYQREKAFVTTHRRRLATAALRSMRQHQQQQRALAARGHMAASSGQQQEGEEGGRDTSQEAAGGGAEEEEGEGVAMGAAAVRPPYPVLHRIHLLYPFTGPTATNSNSHQDGLDTSSPALVQPLGVSLRQRWLLLEEVRCFVAWHLLVDRQHQLQRLCPQAREREGLQLCRPLHRPDLDHDYHGLCGLPLVAALHAALPNHAPLFRPHPSGGLPTMRPLGISEERQPREERKGEEEEDDDEGQSRRASAASSPSPSCCSHQSHEDHRSAPEQEQQQQQQYKAAAGVGDDRLPLKKRLTRQQQQIHLHQQTTVTSTSTGSSK